ncbi:hypothetical protein GTA62_10725 [Roseobacter sp. HKCCD9010]|jgi:hypothetical protein|uniref:hypothetical protein n=2 Tax=unclassified Roseobacter TaxID=196798 RepID=UPI0011A1DF0E|nr:MULTISPECIES: hypothetical protein [unclassified Roseobacter]NNV67980.1 hypothetical protein [Roseobacter sp. HKCCD8474]NNV94110.1 hypothetical protein [Roseobacter sp. HKCCD8914]NNW10564.1 hypothetical protein [Roseobacter sp. HKCCD8484]NNW15397.1 hypothetical protein [Roseobacter sp. HKCCD8832]NNW40966.1 hypothetical protein [Roseobacter sp. HKCCD8654]NNW53742.1 hypothetical protein [Roseobacter sp. HKCCD8284]NNW70267.1 hypothetical protein [Roseobacter sp. HKCCD8193]NNW78780.1 hypothe
MMDGPMDQRALRHEARDARDGQVRSVLAVALSANVIDLLPRHVLEPNSIVQRVSYEMLGNVTLIGTHAPLLILSPLVTPMFDALDMAQFLTESGYRGRYLALVDKLPSANLIRREVAAQSPDLNFDMIVLDGSSPLHSL